MRPVLARLSFALAAVLVSASQLAQAETASRPPPPPAWGAPPPGAQPAAAPPPLEKSHRLRRPAELFLGFGFGNAVCDHDKPENDCAVDGAATALLGGAWRLHDHWALGAELGLWSYKVRDSWRGKLDGSPDSAELSSAFLALIGRWYWFDDVPVDPYLEAGVGFASLTGKVESAGETYEFAATGAAYPLGIGADYHLTKGFRLGLQALAYLQISSKVCSTVKGDETCEDATKDANALPWRIALTGTFMLGGD